MPLYTFLMWNFSFQFTSAFVIALFLLSRDKTIHDSYFIIVIFILG